MELEIKSYYSFLPLLLLLLSGCQPKVYLVPPPVGQGYVEICTDTFRNFFSEELRIA